VYYYVPIIFILIIIVFRLTPIGKYAKNKTKKDGASKTKNDSKTHEKSNGKLKSD